MSKAPTGIPGLDHITTGGLPRGRATLIVGGPGSGKTILGMEILIRGITEYGEPGVAMTFEETADEIRADSASLGHNLAALEASGQLVIDEVQVERREIEETGEYDLEGLFIRLDYAIKKSKAKRVYLDTVEVLFSGLRNPAIVRAELRRLFRWLKSNKITAIVSAEAGVDTFTRFGLEEYVADCVIMLDHRVDEQVSTRRIRVVKYRGSSHGTNEFPFLLDQHGISVVPITSAGLAHTASTERVSSGIRELDAMLGGRGFFRGSSVLITGTAGTGKSSLAARFAESACERGQTALYFAFEESPSQILRNMASVNINLERWIKKGTLHIQASRPTATGLENHLAGMQRHIQQSRPDVVVVDPITNLVNVGQVTSVKSMLTRLIDLLKSEQITAVFTNLTFGERVEETTTGISSLMDTWLLLRDLQAGASRTRVLYVLKSRGMAHSNEVRELKLSQNGISIMGVPSENVILSTTRQSA